MKKFTQYLQEAATEGAVFEEVVVAAWNGTEGPAVHGIDPNAGKGVVDYLKSQGLSGHAKKLETGENVTPTWSQFWRPDSVPGSTKTPKTDIMIGTHRISMKMGPAQLMSGGQNESKATFYAATQKIGGLNDALLSEIQTKLDKLTQSSVAAGEVAAEIKKGKDKFLVDANAVNNEVKALMKQAFANNQAFRRSFVGEAMTGDVKFGEKANACAEYVLSTDAKGLKPQLHKAHDPQFLDKVASKTDVTVRFKSTSVKSKGVKTGEYRYWSVVAVGVKKLDEEIRQAGDLLTENVIADIFRRVRDFIVGLFKKAIEWMKKSIQNVVEFFDLEPEIEFNNTINFQV